VTSKFGAHFEGLDGNGIWEKVGKMTEANIADAVKQDEKFKMNLDIAVCLLDCPGQLQ